MRTPIRSFAVALLLAAAACSVAVRHAPQPAQDRDAIVHALQASTDDWNRGNLDGFLVTYADDATFVGSTGLVRGKQAIHDKYVASYFHPGGALPGLLAFSDLEVRMLGDDHALVLGRYVVTDRATHAQTGTGPFSLTWERRPEGWRIIHDHSS